MPGRSSRRPRAGERTSRAARGAAWSGRRPPAGGRCASSLCARPKKASALPEAARVSQQRGQRLLRGGSVQLLVHLVDDGPGHGLTIRQPRGRGRQGHTLSQHRRGPGAGRRAATSCGSAGPGTPSTRRPRRGCPGGAPGGPRSRALRREVGLRTHTRSRCAGTLRARPGLRSFTGWMAQRSLRPDAGPLVPARALLHSPTVRPCRVT